MGAVFLFHHEPVSLDGKFGHKASGLMAIFNFSNFSNFFNFFFQLGTGVPYFTNIRIKLEHGLYFPQSRIEAASE